MYIQPHSASYICFSTEVDVGGSWLWGPPWGGLHISHPHSRVSSEFQLITCTRHLPLTMFRASAGVAEHCIMYPVDVVKTRMQALACNTPKFQSKSVVRNILFMMREEGFWRPVQGVQAMALGAGPAHAMYFLSYETMKERLAPKFKQVTPLQFSLNDLLFIVDCSGWCSRVHDAPPGWLWCHLLSRFCDDPSWGILE